MLDYEKMYIKLFGAAETAIRNAEASIEEAKKAIQVLVEAQQLCEEMVMDDESPNLIIFPKTPENSEDTDDD